MPGPQIIPPVCTRKLADIRAGELIRVAYGDQMLLGIVAGAADPSETAKIFISLTPVGPDPALPVCCTPRLLVLPNQDQIALSFGLEYDVVIDPLGALDVTGTDQFHWNGALLIDGPRTLLRVESHPPEKRASSEVSCPAVVLYDLASMRIVTDAPSSGLSVMLAWELRLRNHQPLATDPLYHFKPLPVLEGTKAA